MTKSKDASTTSYFVLVTIQEGGLINECTCYRLSLFANFALHEPRTPRVGSYSHNVFQVQTGLSIEGKYSKMADSPHSSERSHSTLDNDSPKHERDTHAKEGSIHADPEKVESLSDVVDKVRCLVEKSSRDYEYNAKINKRWYPYFCGTCLYRRSSNGSD